MFSRYIYSTIHGFFGCYIEMQNSPDSKNRGGLLLFDRGMIMKPDEGMIPNDPDSERKIQRVFSSRLIRFCGRVHLHL